MHGEEAKENIKKKDWKKNQELVDSSPPFPFSILEQFFKFKAGKSERIDVKGHDVPILLQHSVRKGFIVLFF